MAELLDHDLAQPGRRRTHIAPEGSGKAFAALLHRLNPMAQMLGLFDQSAEAERMEDRLN
ncbi:hypothetical protein [Bradyrhizobium sp. USDA 3364]